MAAWDSILTEANIPGASLRGRKPSELNNEELSFGSDVEMRPQNKSGAGGGGYSGFQVTGMMKGFFGV